MSLVFAALTASALAAPPLRAGRPSVGVTGGTGIALSEPRWGAGGGPSALGCVGAAAWWVYGGYTRAEPDGTPVRTDDHWRAGVNGQGCPAAGGGTGGSLGFALGRQWGGHVYFTTHGTAGLSVYAKEGPDDAGYVAFAPYVKPQVGLGIATLPGVSFEGGAYVMIAPPVWQVVRYDEPNGSFIGQVGLEATVLFGNASPRAFQ